jgi:hypothetical protein
LIRSIEKGIIYLELVTKEKTVHMAIHNKSHHNHALMSLNKMRKDKTLKHKTANDFEEPKR